MQVTSLSFFRFSGIWHRIWAFVHMQMAKGPLRRCPDIGFVKVLGTGRGDGFDLLPNFSVYAILATWPSLEVAKARLEASSMVQGYRERAVESWTVYLAATRSRGSWDQSRPFAYEPPAAPVSVRPLSGQPQAPGPGPVGVITRASIRLKYLRSFWRSVPAVSRSVAEHPSVRFKIGMGELPVMQLMTFSLWDQSEAMQDFAYRGRSPHPQVLKNSRREGWFKEELFARFQVLESQGQWEGVDPAKSPPAHERSTEPSDVELAKAAS